MENSKVNEYLDKEQLEELRCKFEALPVAVKFVVKGVHGREDSKELEEFIREYSRLSPAFSMKIENTPTEQDAPVVELWIDGDPSGVSFCGLPSGKELDVFTSAVLNAGGMGENMPDKLLRPRIEHIEGPAFMFTFVSKGCPGCPDVAEAMNLVSLLNKQFKNMTVDVDAAPEFAKQYGVQSVPAVFVNGELLSTGHTVLGQLVSDLEKYCGSIATPDIDDHSALGFDAIVAGGGPAGVSAAVYLARKGLKTAVVAGMVGGQVASTVAIENLISVPHTSGSELADDLRKHLESYDIKLFENRNIVESDLKGRAKRVKTDIGEWFEAPALIIATGASWKKLGIIGEDKYMGRGVAFCTHCDGPFYKGRKVAVAGGGNSGVEAAIDLAGICTHVDLFEYASELKADKVLCSRLEKLSNVTVHCSSQLVEVLGNDTTGVTSVKVKDLTDGSIKDYRVEGVFVQVGLSPNSSPFSGEVEVNGKGEIVTDPLGRTGVTGIYAAGDVTDTPYKQIVVAIGDGAKAALSVVADRIRGRIG